MRVIGVAFDAALADASAFGGAVTNFRAGRVAVDFDKLRVVHIGTERTIDCLKVGAVTVAGQGRQSGVSRSLKLPPVTR